MLPPLLLPSTCRVRPHSRLADVDPGPEPTVAALLGLAGDQPEVWLGGGEPTLRPDLPALVRAFGGRAGLVSDGLALAQPGVLATLPGLRALRLVVGAGRPEANDWLLGVDGASRAQRRALRLALEAGLPVEAEVLLSRAGLLLLDETIAVLRALGVARVRLRGLWPAGAVAADSIALLPRPEVVHAALLRLAARDVAVAGVPACAAGGLAVDPERRAGPDVLRAPGCAACPALGGCPGPDARVVGLWGRAELDRLGGGAPLPADAVFRIDPGKTTRSLRQELARLHGARRLEVEGDLLHPGALPLLREALRLGVPQVLLRAALGPTLSWPESEVVRLVGLAAVEPCEPRSAEAESRLAALGLNLGAVHAR